MKYGVKHMSDKLFSKTLNDKTFAVSLTASALTPASSLHTCRRRKEARRFMSLLTFSALMSVSLFVSAAAHVRIKGNPGCFQTIQEPATPPNRGPAILPL